VRPIPPGPQGGVAYGDCGFRGRARGAADDGNKETDVDDGIEQARQYFLQGLAHFEAQRYPAARECFESALCLVPGRPSVLGNLGITLFQMREFAQAIPVLQQTIAADANYGDAWISLGLCHEALGQWQMAADALSRGLALEPNRPRLWLVCGQCRMRAGQMASAVQAFDQVIAQDASLAQGWSGKGDVMRQLHRLDEAAACFEKAIALGADTEMNRFYLASVRRDANVAHPPRAYVEALFDEYADDFQTHLVDTLRYRGHELLVQPLVGGGRRYGKVVDLGCGTGLCGALLQPIADAIEGVDLSAAMLEQARHSGVYRSLVHDDLGTYLGRASPGVDLVIAADVFNYIGDLGSVFGAVRRILRPGGQFAFTVERSLDGASVSLLPSLRYTHSEAHIRALAQTHGFSIDSMLVAPIRNDGLEPVQGLYAYLS
jgi:predicted TPR repeat methyltransferase